MTDVSVADQAREVSANFTSGFDDVPVKPIEAEVPKADADKEVEKPGANGAAPVVAEPAAAVAAKPKWARIALDEWNNTKALAGKVSGLESQIARLAGTVGSVQKAVQDAAAQAQAQTPYGLEVELTDEMFAELAADYPALAKVNRSILESIFKVAKIKGTGTEPKTEQPPTEVPKQSAALTREDVAKVLQEEKAKEVSDKFIAAHPNWREKVGAPDVDGGPHKPSGDAFHAWLKTQPAEYQQKVSSTEDLGVLHAALDLFDASLTKVPAEKPTGQNRRAVIDLAVTAPADGAGPLPKRPQTEAEAMRDGFRDG